MDPSELSRLSSSGELSSFVSRLRDTADEAFCSDRDAHAYVHLCVVAGARMEEVMAVKANHLARVESIIPATDLKLRLKLDGEDALEEDVVWIQASLAVTVLVVNKFNLLWSYHRSSMSIPRLGSPVASPRSC